MVMIAVLCAVGRSQTVPPPPGAAPPTKVSSIDLQEALQLARKYSPQFQAAAANARIAHERRLQARDARLPTVDGLNQFIYTEGNKTPSGVFIANDGVHVYNEEIIVRQDLLSFVRGAGLHQAEAAEAVAKAQQEIAKRGLDFTVVQRYYDLLANQKKMASAGDAVREAENFAEIARKQEQAGVVSHVDTIKGQLQLEQRSRDLQNSQLAVDQARLALAVLLFPNFDQSFAIVDTLATLPPLPSWDDALALASRGNPELQSAKASVKEAKSAATVARYGYLPALSANFYYGIDANQFASSARNVAGVNRSNLPNFQVANRQNLGYSADATLKIPLWNWGSTQSKVRQAEFGHKQAEVNLSFAQRQVRANLQSFYEQAQTQRNQVGSLGRSQGLAGEELRLTLLRYQAGEATALEVVTAGDSATLAQSAYADGLARYQIALADLETLTGSW